ncbi:MAG: type II toxin-antitoxin system RelE/ParE family toxin [Vicinamibacterales bacterium]|nr:type II toxin-antitoxin system RelE/ParE family toxin [Vicinamibacterales bacterium]
MTPSRASVVWTAVALADVERLASYLLDESPGRAEAILERIISRAESLGRFPERGRTPPELRSVGDQTWREIQERPWRILYRIAGPQRVEIHGVIDGRRNLMDILLERILRS